MKLNTIGFLLPFLNTLHFTWTDSNCNPACPPILPEMASDFHSLGQILCGEQEEPSPPDRNVSEWLANLPAKDVCSWLGNSPGLAPPRGQAQPSQDTENSGDSSCLGAMMGAVGCDSELCEVIEQLADLVRCWPTLSEVIRSASLILAMNGSSTR